MELRSSSNPLANCVHLLESERYDDNRLGMEQLVILVNRELVNSQKTNSIAGALIFETDVDGTTDNDCDESGNGSLSKRLRAIFPTFFYDEQYQQQYWVQQGETTTSVDRPTTPRREPLQQQQHPQNKNKIIKNKGGKDTVISEGSESTDDSNSLYSDLSNSTGRRHRPSLKLPALRVLVSSLELLSRTKRTVSSSSSDVIDLSDWFWKTMVAYLTESLEVFNIERVETALCVKVIRLLKSIDSQTMDPFIRNSVIPFITNIKDYGRSSGDKMLVRECDRLMKSMS
jgi:hypothetical protein